VPSDLGAFPPFSRAVRFCESRDEYFFFLAFLFIFFWLGLSDLGAFPPFSCAERLCE
jgi:hypothetical protein